MTPTAVSLAGLNLQSGYFHVTNTDAFGSAEREIKAVQLAREDGAVAVFKRFKDRNVTVEGYIKAPDKASAEASLDQLKTAITLAQAANLDVAFRSGTRRWGVISANQVVPRGGQDISYIPFSLQLYSPKPYATDGTTSSIVTSQAITGASVSLPVNVLGSYPAQPVITLVVNAINPTVTSTDITIGNPVEGRYLTIRGNRAVNDVITIDCQNKQLYINDVLTQPQGGQFPLWASGAGTMEISDSATTRNITVSDNYPPRWL